jgi:hypothetical protein
LTEKDVIRWKIEAVTLIFIVICISLSFYLAFLSFQTLDETLSKQLVTFAASFLITGITIFAALTVHLGMKKAFSRTEDIVKSENTVSKNNED